MKRHEFIKFWSVLSIFITGWIVIGVVGFFKNQYINDTFPKLQTLDIESIPFKNRSEISVEKNRLSAIERADFENFDPRTLDLTAILKDFTDARNNIFYDEKKMDY